MANENFRGELIKMFWKEYEDVEKSIAKNSDKAESDGKVKSKAHAVVAYYGIGGVGKTWLVEELEKEIKEKPKNEKPKVVTVKFTKGVDVFKVIKSIKQQLEENYNFQFYYFNKGLQAYSEANKGNVDDNVIFMQKNDKTSFAVSACAFLAEKAAEGLTNGVFDTAAVGLAAGGAAGLAGGIVTGGAAGLAGGIVAGLVGVAFGKAIKKGGKILKDKTDTTYKEELGIFNTLKSENESLDHLFDLLIRDLEYNLRKEKKPLVIIFDTYEFLVNELKNGRKDLEKDYWIRGAFYFNHGLVPNINGVLWVIAGREELKWEQNKDNNKDRGSNLSIYPVKGLEKPFVKDYFEKRGIHNSDLSDKLYNLTEGVPLYLEYCVKRYHSIKNNENREPEYEDFGRTCMNLTNLYLRDMDSNMQSVVRTLCCLGRWTDEMAQDVIINCKMSVHCLDLYKKIKEISFIDIDIPSKTYSINRTVRDAILSDIDFSKENKKIILDNAIDFCKNKTKQFKQTSSADDSFYLTQLMNYGVEYYES